MMSVWKVITRYSGQLLKAMDYGLPGYGEFYLRVNTAWSIKYIIQPQEILLLLYISKIIISFLKIIVIKIFLSKRRLFLNRRHSEPSIVQRSLKKEKNTVWPKRKEETLLLLLPHSKLLPRNLCKQERDKNHHLNSIPSTRRKLCNSDIISQPEYKRANKFT